MKKVGIFNLKPRPCQHFPTWPTQRKSDVPFRKNNVSVCMRICRTKIFNSYHFGRERSRINVPIYSSKLCCCHTWHFNDSTPWLSAYLHSLPILANPPFPPQSPDWNQKTYGFWWYRGRDGIGVKVFVVLYK